MRVNLLLNSPADARSGYLNVDAFAAEGVTHGDPFNLDALVDDGEVEEIVAQDVLGYAPSTKVDSVLRGWVRKLAHGGAITIGLVDLNEFARLKLAGHLSNEQSNSLLYGEQSEPWDLRKFSADLEALASVMKSQGLKILSKRVANGFAVVTGERPGV